MKTLEVLGALPMKGSSSQDVLDLQKQLQRVGLNPGPADGAFGAKTEAAVKEAQGFLGLTKTGIVTDELLMKLAATKSGAFVIYSPASPLPKTASTDMVVADGGSSVVARAKAVVGKAKLVLFPEGAPIYKQPGVYLGAALLGFSALFLFAPKTKAKLAGLMGLGEGKGARVRKPRKAKSADPKEGGFKVGAKVRYSERAYFPGRTGVVVGPEALSPRMKMLLSMSGNYSPGRSVIVRNEDGSTEVVPPDFLTLDGLCGRGGRGGCR